MKLKGSTGSSPSCTSSAEKSQVAPSFAYKRLFSIGRYLKNRIFQQSIYCIIINTDIAVAGFTGDAIEKGIRNDRIITDFIKLESGISRINIKIKAGVETEIRCV